MERIELALQMCAAFQRCMNYPKNEDGILALAQGLVKASDTTGVYMRKIVDECLESSMYCPTDADMLAVARDCRGPAEAEGIPIPNPETVRKQWRELAHHFPHIMENGRLWRDEFRAVCSKIKNRMGSEKWLKATSREKVRVGIAMGMKTYIEPPRHHTIDDMGPGVFVRRMPLR